VRNGALVILGLVVIAGIVTLAMSPSPSTLSSAVATTVPATTIPVTTMPVTTIPATSDAPAPNNLVACSFLAENADEFVVEPQDMSVGLFLFSEENIMSGSPAEIQNGISIPAVAGVPVTGQLFGDFETVAGYAQQGDLANTEAAVATALGDCRSDYPNASGVLPEAFAAVQSGGW
jgi:hypothetical protein